MSTISVTNVKHESSASNNLVLTSGGDTQVIGALGLGGATYGTSGQFLQSQGSGSAPQWATASTGNDYNFASGSASGTSILITGIPSTAMQITFNLSDIGWTTAGYNPILRVGNSSGIRSTAGDYYWVGGFFGAGQGALYSNTGIITNYGFTATSDRLHGSIYLSKFSSNTWKVIYQGISRAYSGGTTYVLGGAGSAYAGGTLDRVELSMNGGSFNTGAYNVNVLTE